MATQSVDRRRRGPAPKWSLSKPIHIFTDDPEIKLLQGIVNGMHHVGERHLTIRHLKLIITVYLIGKAFNKLNPGRDMIAAIARLDPSKLDPELSDLVEKRYLCEIISKYGEMKMTYKLGSMGGTLMRHITGGVKSEPATL